MPSKKPVPNLKIGGSSAPKARPDDPTPANEQPNGEKTGIDGGEQEEVSSWPSPPAPSRWADTVWYLTPVLAALTLLSVLACLFVLLNLGSTLANATQDAPKVPSGSSAHPGGGSAGQVPENSKEGSAGQGQPDAEQGEQSGPQSSGDKASPDNPSRKGVSPQGGAASPDQPAVPPVAGTSSATEDPVSETSGGKLMTSPSLNAIQTAVRGEIKTLLFEASEASEPSSKPLFSRIKSLMDDQSTRLAALHNYQAKLQEKKTLDQELKKVEDEVKAKRILLDESKAEHAAIAIELQKGREQVDKDNVDIDDISRELQTNGAVKDKAALVKTLDGQLRTLLGQMKQEPGSKLAEALANLTSKAENLADTQHRDLKIIWTDFVRDELRRQREAFTIPPEQKHTVTIVIPELPPQQFKEIGNVVMGMQEEFRFWETKVPGLHIRCVVVQGDATETVREPGADRFAKEIVATTGYKVPREFDWKRQEIGNHVLLLAECPSTGLAYRPSADEIAAGERRIFPLPSAADGKIVDLILLPAMTSKELWSEKEIAKRAEESALWMKEGGNVIRSQSVCCVHDPALDMRLKSLIRGALLPQDLNIPPLRPIASKLPGAGQ